MLTSENTSEVYKPRPCVAASTVRSERRTLSMSVRTSGMPMSASGGIQKVLAPSRSSVIQTPASVAIMA